MKKVLLAGLCALVLIAGDAFAAKGGKSKLSKSCPTIVGLAGYMYKNSAPLRAGGVGTRLIGYRKNPTLLALRGKPMLGRTTIYDKAGNAIGSCVWAPAHDTSDGRYRCTMDTAGLRRTAIRNTKSPEIYFTVKGKKCVKVLDAGRCYGSVKGLCNQTIG